VRSIEIAVPFGAARLTATVSVASGSLTREHVARAREYLEVVERSIERGIVIDDSLRHAFEPEPDGEMVAGSPICSHMCGMYEVSPIHRELDPDDPLRPGRELDHAFVPGEAGRDDCQVRWPSGSRCHFLRAQHRR